MARTPSLLLLLPLFFTSLFFQEPALAVEKSLRVNDCLYLLNPKDRHGTLLDSLRDGDKAIRDALKKEPQPEFVSIKDEHERRWTGVKGPKVFDHFIPAKNGLKFLQIPSVNAEVPWVALRTSPETGGFLNIEVPWKNDKVTTTTVYFNKPVPGGKPAKDQSYLFGPDIPLVILDIHGGGTPSAESGNGSSKGSFYVKRGIGFISIDQAGHGKGTRDEINGMDDMVNYNLTVANQLVHPDVPMVLAGHSWGGEIATYAHKISQDERLKRILGFLPFSAPADLSKGGSLQERFQLEDQLNERLMKDLELQGQIAESDWDFLSNTVRNGKVNPVGSWFTAQTMMDYNFSVLPKKERERLKPALAIMGKSDGLVYVGREEIFEHYYGAMLPKGNFVVFAEGQTFKGTGIATGHQVFDKEIILGDLLNELNIPHEDLGPGADPIDSTVHEANYRGLLFMREITGRNFNRVNYEGSHDIYSRLYKAFLLYSNNFAFRNYIQNSIEYIRRPLPEVAIVKAEYTRLQRYVDRVHTINKEKIAQGPRLIKEGIKDFERNYHILGGKQSALKELAAVNTPERTRELNDLITKIERVENHFDETYTDLVHQAELEKVQKSIAKKLLQIKTRKEKKEGGPNPTAWYNEDLFSKAHRMVDLIEGTKKINLSRKKYEKKRPEKHKNLVDSILKELGIPTEHGINAELEVHNLPFENLSPHDQTERKKLIESALQSIKLAEKGMRSRYSIELSNRIKGEVDFPQGISSLSDARWELGLDHSPARKTLVQEFISRYDSQLAIVKSDVDSSFQERLAALEVPEGISSFEQAEAMLQLAERKLEDTYVPYGPKSDQYQDQVTQIEILQKKLESLRPPMDEVNIELKRIKGRREGVIRQLHKFYDESMADIHNPDLPPKLTRILKKSEEALLEWIEVVGQLEKRQNRLAIEARELGQSMDDTMANLPEELEILFIKFKKKRNAYYNHLNQVRQIWVSLAFKGDLSELKIAGADKIQGLMINLLGDSFLETSEPGEKSLEGQLISLEDKRNTTQSLVEKTRKELFETKYQYLFDLRKDDMAESYFKMTKVRIIDLFNRDFESLWKTLTEGDDAPVYKQALENALAKWESQWGQVLQENNLLYPAWYPGKPYYQLKGASGK